MEFFAKIWSWFDGKKTLIASVLVGVPVIWEQSALILVAAGVDAVALAGIGASILLVVGWVHKFLKFLGVVSVIVE